VPQDLLLFTDRGIYCPRGKFYIDPWLPVDKAIITHAHGDHAYRGHHAYLSHHNSIPILNYRLGKSGGSFYSLEYGEPLFINGVKVSLHPAGHIVGSAQIRLEYGGQVWVVSGDYKLEKDGISTPFEPVKCDVFITESTFGLPCFWWEKQELIFGEINEWWRQNRAQGITSVLLGYALGKTQRLLKGLDPSIGPIYAHGSVWNMTELFRQLGIALPPMGKTTAAIPKQELIGSMILAPPSTAQSAWMNRFFPYRIGYASGWMSLRGIRRRRGADKGFILSDHADWPGLQQAVQETGASRIIVMHGFTAPFARWLSEQGYRAEEAYTAYGDDEDLDMGGEDE
jgi:putative mRNA 3-end processing factor